MASYLVEAIPLPSWIITFSSAQTCEENRRTNNDIIVFFIFICP